MTVENTSNKVQHTVDGVQTDFPYDFVVYNEEDMYAYFDDVEQMPSLYSVTGLGDPNGGLVIFDVAPDASIETLTLVREMALEQQTDYTIYGSFPPERVETDFDIGVLIDQQLTESVSRALKAPISDTGGFDYSLPSPMAGHAYIVNETNDGFVLSEYPLDDTVNLTNTARDQAETAEANAAVSASEAAACSADAHTSAVASEASANLAEQWAEEAEDVEVTPGQYSSYHWAQKAEDITSSWAPYAVNVIFDDSNVPFTATEVQTAIEEAAARGGATGGGVNQVFFENEINVTDDYTITTDKNAMSAGPIEIDNGVTVTVPDGSVWTIV